MLIAGILLRNIAAINIAKDINLRWSIVIKSLSLVIILIHGGLKCDSAVLLRFKCLVTLLSCVPCIGEAIAIAIVTRYVLAFPWAWSFVMGFVMSPLSPAVIVPQLVKIQELGYGIDKGIPTLILAASSIDGTIAIMGFAIFAQLAQPTPEHKSLTFTVLHGPLEVLIGLLYGFGVGVLFWYIPSYELSEPFKSRFRYSLLASAGVFAVFGGKLATFSGAGAFGTLTLTLVANYGWFKRGNKYDNVVSRDFKFIWDFFQPLLFGLIGTQMDIYSIQLKFLGYCILLIVVGLIARASLAILSVTNIGFTWKEKLFVGITWTPKATVQAAIGSLALDTAILRQSPETTMNLARMVLIASIIVILVTAPLGAIAIDKAGPRLLTRSPTLPRQKMEEAIFDDSIPIKDLNRKTDFPIGPTNRQGITNQNFRDDIHAKSGKIFPADIPSEPDGDEHSGVKELVTKL
ncbi:unnamed protein product [Gordionus sp. m RMFG-2023]